MSDSGSSSSSPMSLISDVPEASVSDSASQNGILSMSSLGPRPSQVLERTANPKLCRNCREMLLEAGKLNAQDQKDHSKLKTVFESTELPTDYLDRNCALCVIFLSSLSVEQIDRMREIKRAGTIGFSVNFLAYVSGKSYGLTLIFNILSEGYLNNNFSFMPSEEFHHYSFDSSLESSTASHASLNTVKDWLGTCTKHHDECSNEKSSNNNLSNPAFLPTRLIDVGDDDAPCLRLVVSAQIRPEAIYITLSHCWGRHIPKRLLRNNISVMTDKIVLEELSKTFQDAIFLTRRLKVRYIWIDALCIIQDSEQDWQEESSKMSQIYSGTYCNLSATAARDGSVGMFFDRDVHSFQALEIKIGRAFYHVIDTNIWESNVEHAPLNRRAWVFQERMLSPRNIHFGSNQIYWECRERSCCESYPMGFPSCFPRSVQAKRLTLKDGSTLRANRKLPADSALDAYMIWGLMVERYSMGNLSKETDKLVAIAGLAAQMQPLVDDKYLAGMWERHLASTLTWSVTRHVLGNSNGTRPQTYIAPSWSWASVNSKVLGLGNIAYADGRNILIEMVASHVDYSTSNVFGQVEGGFICLRGSLATLTVPPSGYYPVVHRKSPMATEIIIHADLTFRDNQRVETGHNNLYALLTTNRQEQFQKPWVEGLLLEPTENMAEFRRWGMFLAVGAEEVNALREGCKFFDSKADESGMEYCDDGEGGYRYTITII